MRHPLVAAARVRFRRVILSISALSGLVLTGALPTEARANDDTGMMAFVLGKSARRAPSRVIFDAPTYRQVSPYARPALQPVRMARHKPLARRHAQSAVHPSVKTAMAPATEVRPESSPLPPPRPERALLGTAHLSDRTLRAGDIVATAAGLRVFRGSYQYPYRDADFGPLASAGQIHNRAVLEALDRTMRRGEPSRHQIALQAPKVAPLRVRTAQTSDAPVAPAGTIAKPVVKAAAPSTPEKAPAGLAVAQTARAYAPAAQAKEPASAVRAIERALKRDGARPAQAAAPRKIRQARSWRRPSPYRPIGTAWASPPVRTMAPSYVGFWR